MPGDWPFAPGPWLALACVGVAYLAGMRSLRRRSRPWRPWRTVAFAAGLLTIGAALVSPLATRDELFTVHMAQHMLLGMLGLYFTPLYDQTLLHELVHLHLVAAGCLFAWMFIGVDPVPRRGSFALRSGLLLFALGSHAALAKLLYAGHGDLTTVSARQLHDGARLMYYAGDAVDALLLLAFFGQWYVAGARRLERERRQAARTRTMSVKAAR